MLLASRHFYDNYEMIIGPCLGWTNDKSQASKSFRNVVEAKIWALHLSSVFVLMPSTRYQTLVLGSIPEYPCGTSPSRIVYDDLTVVIRFYPELLSFPQFPNCSAARKWSSDVDAQGTQT